MSTQPQWSESDHEDLATAANLINSVLDRHPFDVTLPAMSFLCEAVHNIQMGERYLEGTSHE